MNNIPNWLMKQLPYKHCMIDVEGKQMHVMEKGSGKPIVMVLSLIHISEPTRPY